MHEAPIPAGRAELSSFRLSVDHRSPRVHRRWYRHHVTVRDKLVRQILAGRSDSNIPFEPLCQMLRWLGFHERISGDHHIFGKTNVVEIINLQPLPSGKAKAYQVKQVRNVIVRYKLVDEADGN
jgi:hypothetical protein